MQGRAGGAKRIDYSYGYNIYRLQGAIFFRSCSPPPPVIFLGVGSCFLFFFFLPIAWLL